MKGFPLQEREAAEAAHDALEDSERQAALLKLKRQMDASHGLPEQKVKIDNFETEASRLSDHLQHDHPAEPLGRSTAPLQVLEAICAEIYERWDKDMRSGKLLQALCGALPGYRADVDRVRAALADDLRAGKAAKGER